MNKIKQDYITKAGEQIEYAENFEIFRKRFRQLVYSNGMNYASLAAKLGLPENAFYRYDNGTRRPETKTLIAATGAADIGGIPELLANMKSNLSVEEYRPQNVFEPSDSQTVSERDILTTQKRKQEIALNRLQTIYLYSDDAMPESEYITQRKAIQDSIDSINDRLNALAESTAPSTEEMKLSYQIMTKYLEDPSRIDFERFAKTVDTTVPKNFFRTIIDHMTAIDGNITSVTFSNSITLTFKYL